jgi:hypothetical protein
MALKRACVVLGLSISGLLIGCGSDPATATSGSGGSGGSGGHASTTTAGSAAGGASATSTGSVTTATTGSAGTGPGGSTGSGPTLGGCALFPADNPWNLDISGYPVDPMSSTYIASIGAEVGLHPDFGAEYDGAPNGIPYVVVPANQPMVNVDFVDSPDESDPGPYPIPPDAPIEGGPQGDGDRHVLVLQQGSCTLFETFSSFPKGAKWEAGSGAVWHLDKNEIRKDEWTSADAAGLAILPGLVRYDEAVEIGEIKHALRVTVSSAQKAYIYPASHSDGSAGSDTNAPPMGLRLRLRASFDVTGFPPAVQVMLKAMKKYGLMVADSGSDWFISGAPDSKWSDDDLHELGKVVGSDFEAVTTGAIHPY